jgi:hypothetical protein
MKKLLFLTGLLFSFILHARSAPVFVSVCLADTVDHFADCGYMITVVELKFKVRVETTSLNKDQFITIRFTCPNEQYGRGYFVTGKNYVFLIREINPPLFGHSASGIRAFECTSPLNADVGLVPFRVMPFQYVLKFIAENGDTLLISRQQIIGFESNKRELELDSTVAKNLANGYNKAQVFLWYSPGIWKKVDLYSYLDSAPPTDPAIVTCGDRIICEGQNKLAVIGYSWAVCYQ